MVCTDRQLTPTQIADGFSNSRVGVARAIRPFSGQASPENLADYINRELFPAVKAGREKLNEVYLQVADNAPSANPLAYYFSTSTVNADPTPGRTRLDSATQNAATVIRVSELNAQLQSAVTWLDVMAGSSTLPIGVVTMNDRINPGRFLRFNLDTMTDQGTYWDLGVTPIESSHDNPFVEGQPVVVSFIASVASGGAVPGPPAVTNRQIGVVSHVGGNSVGSVSRLAFSNGNGVSWNLSTGANAATVLGSIAPISVIAGTSTVTLGALSFSDAGGITWSVITLPGSTIIAGTIVTTVASTQGSIRISAGASSVLSSGFTFSNSNNVSFGINAAGVVTATATVASTADPQIGLVSLVGGNSVSSVTRLVFSNASNVTWDVSTGANAATIRASVAAGGAGGIAASANGSSQSAGTVVWSNSNNVSFGMNGSTITASATVASTQASILLSAGTTSVLASSFRFSNANAIGFGMNAGGVITAIADSGISGISGGTLGLGGGATGLSFSNANNVSWTLSTNAGTPGAAFVLGSATVASTQASIRISAGTTSVLSSGFTLSNSHNVSWTMNNGTLVASASFPADSILGLVSHVGGFSVTDATRLAFSDSPTVSWLLSTGVGGATMLAAVASDSRLGLVSHVGGNSLANVTRLAFSNASNVTWSLSTAAGAVTVLASVDAGGGGGIAIAASGATASTGTLVFDNNNTLATVVGQSRNNVLFAVNGQTMSATALIGVAAEAAGGFSPIHVTGMNFVASNGITFGTSSTSNGSQGLRALITASFARPAVQFWRNASENDVVAINLAGFLGSMWVFPLGMGPFPGDMTINTLEMIGVGVGNLTTSSPQWGVTIRGALYSSNNSTQVSRVNSFSTVISSASHAVGSSSLRNNLYGGFRRVTVGTAAWGASPVLSDGVNYWLALAWSTSGTSVFDQVIFQRAPAFANNLNGVMGVSSATSSLEQRGFMPFYGRVNTTSPPTTIGTVDILTASNSLGWFIPILQLRNGIGI